MYSEKDLKRNFQNTPMSELHESHTQLASAMRRLETELERRRQHPDPSVPTHYVEFYRLSPRQQMDIVIMVCTYKLEYHGSPWLWYFYALKPNHPEFVKYWTSAHNIRTLINATNYIVHHEWQASRNGYIVIINGNCNYEWTCNNSRWRWMDTRPPDVIADKCSLEWSKEFQWNYMVHNLQAANLNTRIFARIMNKPPDHRQYVGQPPACDLQDVVRIIIVRLIYKRLPKELINIITTFCNYRWYE